MCKEVVLYVFIVTLVLATTIDAQEVEIPQGILRGDTGTNRDGAIYYSFRNIPYAQPPVGDLRFKAPERAEGWEGIRDATQDLPQCVQADSDQTQEDCLYLNIHTPELPADEAALKPVMVYIHGGAYRLGDGREANYGPQFLITKNVVVVTINYRLGVFGFITLDDPNLGFTGNAGLKDQVLALQWVQDNIEYFGGDPNNVLIFGESAGAMSVHLHLLSPMPEGLFHKAISESGVSMSPLIINNLRNTAVILAEHLGFPTDDWAEMMTLLQNASAESLLNGENALTVDHVLFSAPKVEIESNEPTFLAREPMDIITSGDFHKVPFLHGFNEREGTLLYFEIEDDGVSPLVRDFTRYIPVELKIEPGSDSEQDIIRRLRDFYYDGGEPSRDTIINDMHMYRDFAFAFPHYRTSIQQLRTTSNPIYLYYFTAVTELEEGTDTGAGHTAELLYLWYSGTTFEEGSNADLVSRNMVDMWTNFAIYGNPTPEGLNYTWEPFQENQNNFLRIATEGSIPGVNVLPENIQLWSDIYEDYYQS